MSQNNTVSASGISFASVLGIVFIILKLTGVIDWSWLWVLSPFWIPFAVVGLVIVFFGGIMLLATIVTAIVERR